MEPQIEMLGGYAVRDGSGVPTRLPTRKCRALLAYLALSDGRDIPRQELATLLWPDRSDAQARASLRQELAVLRKFMILAGLAPLVSDKETVRLTLAPTTVDAQHMAHLVKQGTRDDLRQAVGLHGGELLSGLNVAASPFEDWLWTERLRLKSLAQSAYLRLLDYEIGSADTDAAIVTAKGLLSVEPTQEQGHRALMTLFQRAGQRAEALHQFQRCVEVLRRDLDTDPSQETVALADQIRADPVSNGHIKGGKHDEAASKLVASLMSVHERAATHQAIVVVASLAGIAAMRLAVGPKEMAELQDCLIRRCGQVVAAHGGKLLRGPGDRAAAYFPALDREADLKLAVQAAQTIVSKPVGLFAEQEVWARAGVTRGEVLIRADPLGLELADLIGMPMQEACDFVHFALGGEVVISSAIRANFGPRIQAAAISHSRYGAVAPTDRGHVLQSFVAP